jgi:Subtilase family
MSRADFEDDIQHETYFETCEDRLVLSADPLTSLVAQSVPQTDLFRLETPAVRLLGSAGRQTANTGQAWSDLQYVRSTYNLNGAGQTVAIIDSGIAYDHVALGGGFGGSKRVVGGWDFAENDNNPYDDGPAGFHGTHVAGIVGAQDATTPGVASGVDLVALRVIDDKGASSFGWVEQALQWVHTNRSSFANPITTVNLSLGSTWNSNTIPEWANLEDEFAQLKKDGIFISVSAGNDYASYNAAGLSYPAASPLVVPVSSVTSTGQFSTFSQRSSRALAAPGQSVVSTVPDYMFGADGIKNDWVAASGTSMAAPFVAGASTLVRQALQRAGNINIDQDDLYTLLRNTADTFYDASTNANYARVNLRRAVEAALVAETPAAEPETPPVQVNQNWGQLAYREATQQQITSEKWINVTAANRGFFTMESWFNGSQGNIDLELYRADGSLAVASRSAGGGERVDVRVEAGESFRLRIVGTNDNVGLRYTNLVEEAGKQILVHGTAGSDQFQFRASGNTSLVFANGVGYEFNNSVSNDYRYFGEEGNDTIVVYGSAAQETANFNTRNFQLTSTAYSVRTTALETSNVYALGGRDIATFSDTSGNDTYTGAATSGQIAGTGFSQTAHGFESYSVDFAAGGTDTAILYGSNQDDTFTAAIGAASMQGAGVRHVSTKHSNVVGVGVSGNDVAFLNGSAGSDTLNAAFNSTSLAGAGFTMRADSFDRVEAVANNGNDTAFFYDSAGNDTFTGTSTVSYMSSAGTMNVAFGFESVTANSQNGGTDIAGFYDSAGDDVFTQNNRLRKMEGANYLVQAQNFAVNVANASNGGQDTVVLLDLNRSDALFGRGNQLAATSADQMATYGFERAVAYAKTGQRPRVDIAAVDYLFSKSGF